jgi:hypothetical protein
MIAHTTINRLRSTMVCARCKGALIAPERSAYVNEGLIRHEWFCTDCELSITTAINVCPGAITQVTSRVKHMSVELVSA